MATHSRTLAWKIPRQRSLVARVHGVTKSQTRLNDFTLTFHLKKSMWDKSSSLVTAKTFASFVTIKIRKWCMQLSFKSVRIALIVS